MTTWRRFAAFAPSWMLCSTMWKQGPCTTVAQSGTVWHLCKISMLYSSFWDIRVIKSRSKTPHWKMSLNFPITDDLNRGHNFLSHAKLGVQSQNSGVQLLPRFPLRGPACRKFLAASLFVSDIMPNTHRRRRRDETVESRRRCEHNTPVGSRDPVYNFLCW